MIWDVMRQLLRLDPEYRWKSLAKWSCVMQIYLRPKDISEKSVMLKR